MQVRIAFMASVIFTYPAIRKSASTRVFSSSVISRMADMGLNFRIIPPDIKYEDGMLSVTKIDDCTICFRDDSNGKVRKYRKALRTDKPAKYVFWAEYRGARSPEVAHPDHFKTIQPKVKLTSSIPENPEQGYDKVSEYHKMMLTLRTCQKDDWQLYEFEEPVECRKAKFYAGYYASHIRLFPKGYVEISLNGTTFERIAELHP